MTDKIQRCQLKVYASVTVTYAFAHFPHAESANMLIMALSYAQKTNDLTMLTKHVRFKSLFCSFNLF